MTIFSDPRISFWNCYPESKKSFVLEEYAGMKKDKSTKIEILQTRSSSLPKYFFKTALLIIEVVTCHGGDV